MDFKNTGLNEQLLEGMFSMGFEKPTPIQEQAIPLIMQGRDLIACAQTGTGKTAAYLLPILSKLADHPSSTCDTLILVPTRELALQIDQALDGFAYFTHVSSIAVYGGTDGFTFEREKKALVEGAPVIIATPGRLISHLNQEYVKFGSLKHLVLDEGDRMLDMGFQEDIMKIISKLPVQRQTLLFSATMPTEIRVLAKRILRDPAEVSIALSKPVEKVVHEAYLVHDANKNQLLLGIMKEKSYSSVLIFSSRKEKVKVLRHDLRKLGLEAEAIHSDLKQDEREEILRGFASGRIKVLVATDILSRGIDIEGIELVVNYDVPRHAEDYIHRIGRTARADAEGRALTFINRDDAGAFRRIEKMLGSEVRKLPLPASLPAGPESGNASSHRPGRGKKRFQGRGRGRGGKR